MDAPHQIALGQTQSAILQNAYFENDILDLVNVFIPPMASNTMSANVLNRIGNEKAGNGEFFQGQGETPFRDSRYKRGLHTTIYNKYYSGKGGFGKVVGKN